MPIVKLYEKNCRLNKYFSVYEGILGLKFKGMGISKLKTHTFAPILDFLRIT